MKREGVTWFERLLRKYGRPTEFNAMFTWNKWTPEKRRIFFDEIPVSSPTFFNLPIRETKEKICNKYWDEMNSEEQRMIYGFYCV